MQSFLKNILNKLPRVSNFHQKLPRPILSDQAPLLSINITHTPSNRAFGALTCKTIADPDAAGQKSFFLNPVVPLINQCCGMKMRGLLKRRCKDCYFVVRDERLFVMCKTHGRHKQMSMITRPHNTWYLTHATQGKIRPW